MNDVVRTKPITYSCREIQKAWWQKISIHKPGVDVVTGASLLMVLFHGFISLSGGVAAHEELYSQWLGLSVEGLLGGKVWQLVTYALLHGNWFHLFSNVLMIWLIGGRVQTIFSQKLVAKCLLLGTIIGGLFFVGFDSFSGQMSLLVGSSGAAIALFILMACLSPNTKMILIPVRAKNMALGILTASLVLSLAHPGLSIPGLSFFSDLFQKVGLSGIFMVSHSCHLGGGIAGFWLSKKIMGKMITLDDLARTRID